MIQNEVNNDFKCKQKRLQLAIFKNELSDFYRIRIAAIKTLNKKFVSYIPENTTGI